MKKIDIFLKTIVSLSIIILFTKYNNHVHFCEYVKDNCFIKILPFSFYIFISTITTVAVLYFLTQYILSDFSQFITNHSIVEFFFCVSPIFVSSVCAYFFVEHSRIHALYLATNLGAFTGIIFFKLIECD